MTKPKFFDDIAARISELIAASPAKDIEKNTRALLASTFTKLDLVTREEFDAQSALLASTREKLGALEARVAALEAETSQASKL
jgi:BMFP domain-containing protein YqiC